jgi:methionine-rich copper-binding protein CopC
MNPSSVIYQRTLSCGIVNFSTSRRVCSMLFGLFCSLAMLLVMPGMALAQPAHAEYVSSDPAANAMLAKAPTKITIHFAEEVNPAGSDITVYDAYGKVVSTEAAQVDRADLKTMTVPMKADKSEIYVVNWHTASAMEGHQDAGSFRFFVNISPMLKGMVNNPSMSGSSMTSSGSMASNSSSSSSSSGLPIWVTVLVGVLGLLVGALVMLVFGRRPGSSSKAG